MRFDGEGRRGILATEFFFGFGGVALESGLLASLERSTWLQLSAFVALDHHLNGISPPRDDLSPHCHAAQRPASFASCAGGCCMPPHLVEREGGRLAALVAAVELRAVGQRPRVVALARGVLGRVEHAAEVELKTDFRQQQQQQQQASSSSSSKQAAHTAEH